MKTTSSNTPGALLGYAVIAAIAGCATPSQNLRWRRVVLVAEPTYQPLLQGVPETRGMRSGRVVLAPGAHMHRHSTLANEELLVFLSGHARVILSGVPVDMSAGEVLYIPPQTWHEVHNESSEEVRYIYTVAPAR